MHISGPLGALNVCKKLPAADVWPVVAVVVAAAVDLAVAVAAVSQDRVDPLDDCLSAVRKKYLFKSGQSISNFRTIYPDSMGERGYINLSFFPWP